MSIIIHQISSTIIVIKIPLCRFCTTGLPSDIVVEVDDMTFHLHKVTQTQIHPKNLGLFPIIVTTIQSVIEICFQYPFFFLFSFH